MSDIGVLVSQYVFWETLAFVAAAVVLFGVLAEEIPDHTNWISSENWKTRLKKWGAVLLIAGLAGDVITLVQTSRINAELVRHTEPRRLSSEQQAELVSLLKPFARQEFSLAVDPEPECIDLIKTLDAIVLSAGWHVIPAQMQSDLGLGKAAQIFSTGVRIQFASNASRETVRLAQLFASTLNKDEIPTISESNPELKSVAALNIIVGTRD